MADYLKMDAVQRQQELQSLQERYQQYLAKGLHLDMSRGKPCTQQLDLSMDMLSLNDYTAADGTDSRNYGVLEGLPEARAFFAAPGATCSVSGRDMFGARAQHVGSTPATRCGQTPHICNPRSLHEVLKKQVHPRKAGQKRAG